MSRRWDGYRWHNTSGSADEPEGHRGHPTFGEEDRAASIRGRLGVAIVVLKDDGFSETEAKVFVAGVAYEIGAELGETWSTPASAYVTVSRLLDGRGAKHWSLDAIDRALSTIAELLAPPERG